MLRNYIAFQRQLAIRVNVSMMTPKFTPRITTRLFSASHVSQNKDDDKPPVDNNAETAKNEGKEKGSEAAAATETPSTDAATASTKEELNAVLAKLKELQASYLLSLADQENLRQRNTREVANAKEFAIQKFAKDLLDSVDVLGMALESVPEAFRNRDACNQHEKTEITEQLVNLYTGLSLTQAELQQALKRHDIQVDNPIDQVFDPNKHEAVFQAPVPDKEPGTIFVVKKKGYLLKNRILRPAQVGVVAAAQ
ncbi:mitochondrial co-chaperone protein [Mucor ambiguus]|uniref:GrpE protein homolog n=1 Tax=Mucor ambiguus TaxID=91626 RepID=A0A0C9M4X4_9FUNG|nr:mitochondrial co-chaperone protein [Mucor ambiguus]